MSRSTLPTATSAPCAAFTLIELLIVVAIIAILAAIAVPNFLEAQTRAKAARAKADLRTVTTALVTYKVDTNAYPTMLEPGFAFGLRPQLAGSDLKWWYLPNCLSTPVAYITSADLHCLFGGDVTRRDDFPDGTWRRYSYEFIPELEKKVPAFPILTAKYGPTARAFDNWGYWRILCIGPDRAWNPMVQYDPTNGTVSDGNIMRSERDPEGRGL